MFRTLKEILTLETYRGLKISLSYAMIAKAFILAYIVYRTCLSEIGYYVSGLNYILWAAALLFTIIADKTVFINYRQINLNALFIVITAITSYIVASHFDYSVQIIGRLVEGLILGYSVLRMSMRDGDINAVARGWLFSAIIMSVYCILRGAVSNRMGQITIADDYNVNTLGVFLMAAVWFAVYLYSQKRVSVISITTLILEIALFAYTILLSGSRKAALGALAIIVAWSIFCLLPIIRKYSLGKQIGFFAFAILFIFLAIWKFGDAFNAASQVLIRRMSFLSEDIGSNSDRMNLITDALDVFKEHPVAGVGWDNYRLYSYNGKYSHNTYVEILACTGIIGSIIGYTMIGTHISTVLKLRETDKRDKMLIIILLLVLLYIFWGQILYYNVNLLLLTYVLYAYELLAKNKREVRDEDKLKYSE